MQFPKVLVISNNSFSNNSSNGRTLGNLFVGWPKEKLAQFCISTTVPDYDTCDNYFLMTDKAALDGFKHFHKAKRCDIKANENTQGNTIVGGKKQVKTPFKALIRHVIWSNKRWNSVEFQKWVDSFNPELLLVMNSDATFVLDIASYVSKKRSIPLVLFNTEGFYFFKRNYYMSSTFFSDSLFRLYQCVYKRHFRKMMKLVALSIHLNSMLENDYHKIFGGRSMVSYTSSNLKFDISNLHIDHPTFSYLGNFGYNRIDALIEIAEILQDINPVYKLDIYGSIPSPEVAQKLEASSGVIYHGTVSYEEVIKVIYQSTLLFHAESQIEEYSETLRYGFSTKIADSISSGHPFLMYSSPNIAGAQYILETRAGWHASNKNELRDSIVSILTDEDKRNEVAEIAKQVAKKNHDYQINANRFQNALMDILESAK